MTGIVIGNNSYLAGSLRDLPGEWIFLSHKEISENTNLLKSADIVINCALHPALRTSPYDQAHDIDRTIASQIGAQTFYIMLSTRMVYGESLEGPKPFLETDSCVPTTIYGQNKLAVEEGLKNQIDPQKLIILRLANIFGFEPERSTFLGSALNSLKKSNTLYFDIAPQSQRDFLPIAYFSQAIRKITEKPKGGLYNIGSGIPISVTEIATWLIEGYGQGEVRYTGASLAGQFGLNIEKSTLEFGLPKIQKTDLNKEFIECSQKLRSL